MTVPLPKAALTSAAEPASGVAPGAPGLPHSVSTAGPVSGTVPGAPAAGARPPHLELAPHRLPFTIKYLLHSAPAHEVAAFVAAWQASTRFGYHLLMRHGPSATPVCLGVSVAFSSEEAFFFAVAGDAAMGDAGGGQRLAVLKGIMEDGASDKICFDTRTQVKQ